MPVSLEDEVIDVGLLEQIRLVLEISTDEVNRARDLLLEEQRSADARYAASSALLHPEGSTTPANENYSRTQARFADLRIKAKNELPAAFKLLLALKIAEERRDEAEKHRDIKLSEASEKEALGVHPAVADWFARLHKHGVHPHHLKQQAVEMVAIIADLITWKAKDPKFRDADNPWRAVLGVYANRRIERPMTKNSRAERSVLGTPTRNRHISDMGDYMFDELVSASWSKQGRGEPTPEVAETTVSSIIDCSIYPDEATAMPDEQEGAPTDTGNAVEVVTAPAPVAADPAPPSVTDRTAVAPAGPSATNERSNDAAQPEEATPPDDEYALPPGYTDDEIGKLNSAADVRLFLEDDYDLRLQFEAGLLDGRPGIEEVIARIEAASEAVDTTPYRYFLEAAKREGVDAGLEAYREATIRRFVFEIATMPKFAQQRSNFGLK